MQLREYIRLSWRAITGHKLRSALTTLGIVIGIGSVVVFLVMGGGFLADAVEDVETEETPELTVQTQTDVDDGFGWQLDTSPVYTEHDVAQLREIDGVEYVAPDGWISAVQLRSGDQQFTGELNVRATVPDAVEGDDSSLEGDAFSAADEAVLNREAREALSPAAGIGSEITVVTEDGTTQTQTVTGILDDGKTGWNAQPTVYLPLEQYPISIETPRGTEEQAYQFVEIRAESVAVLDRVQADATTYFETESDAQQLTREGYEIRVMSQADQIERFEDLIDQITVFVAAIAGISLLVGSVGIANIMIVSVTERINQIGLMKAIGACRRDILLLFLAESLILGAVGAFLGVLVGLGIGFLAVWAFGWPMVYPLRSIIGVTFVGIAVGALSGLYPAWRGATVDPIEAVRTE